MKPIDLHLINAEQSFKKAINHAFDLGWEASEERIIKLLEPHKMTTKSVGGFLGVCSCGEAIDDYQEHLIALIKGESAKGSVEPAQLEVLIKGEK